MGEISIVKLHTVRNLNLSLTRWIAGCVTLSHRGLVILKGLEAAIFCFCHTHVEHRFIDVFYFQCTDWFSELISILKLFWIRRKVYLRSTSHIFNIIHQNPSKLILKNEFLKICLISIFVEVKSKNPKSVKIDLNSKHDDEFKTVLKNVIVSLDQSIRWK